MNNIFYFFKNKLYKIFTLIFCIVTLSEKIEYTYCESKNLINKTIFLQTYKSPILINFPNPFSNQTQIYIRLPFKKSCILRIYDILGNIVKEFPLQEKDEYIVVWDGRNEMNQKVATGVYICVLEFEGQRIIRKLGCINR